MPRGSASLYKPLKAEGKTMNTQFTLEEKIKYYQECMAYWQNQIAKHQRIQDSFRTKCAKAQKRLAELNAEIVEEQKKNAGEPPAV
jgi:hypothetical protein